MKTILRCDHCNKEFKYISEKKRHEQSHFPQFECGVCSKKFSFISALRRHEKQHERFGKVECSDCGGKFRDEILLKRHMQYAHKGTYSCPKCGDNYSSVAALKSHIKIHRPESERKYRCSHNGCEKSFNFLHHLKHHELTHTNKKQHFCDICKKGFIQLHHLKTHLKTHEPESWLRCTAPECTKKFSTNYARKRHLATHKNKSRIKKSRNSKCNSPVVKKSAEETSFNGSCKKKSLCQEHNGYSVKCNKEQDLNSRIISYSNNNILKSETEDVQNDKNVFNLPIATPTNVTELNSKTEFPASNCKSFLGSCLVSGDSEININCLCAQISTPLNEEFETSIVNENHVPDIRDDIALFNAEVNTKVRENDRNNVCDNIAPNVLTQKQGCCNSNRCEVKPLVQYKNGIVKINETFDIDFLIPMNTKEKTPQDSKFRQSKIKVPFNSCKEVLGKCIAGDDGEGCLCAKMSVDEDQMSAQEMEEITPINFS